MGRPRKARSRRLTIGVPEVLLVELYTLKPEMADVHGQTRYGAMSSYFTQLLTQDLEKIKENISMGQRLATMHGEVAGNGGK